MSKYTEHKNGMTIGWDNTFCCIDRTDPFYAKRGIPELKLPEGVRNFRDGYKAIVSFKSYTFDYVNMINVFVRTPAQQLVFKSEYIKWVSTHLNQDGDTIKIPYMEEYFVLTYWAKHWLNTHIGKQYEMWDAYTRGKTSGGQCIFFKRRKDALAFIAEVNRMLKGIKIGDF